MKIYRCCSDEEVAAYKNGQKYINNSGRGTNTFDYGNGDVKYIHFFLFAESMYHYSKYRGSIYTENFIECDIPFEILKKYYGYGWYEAVIPGYYVPIPEFAIPLDEFDVKFICDISKEKNNGWLRTDDWIQYKNNIPKEYLANYLSGSFITPGYNELSILNVPIDDLLPNVIGKSLH